MVYINNIGKNDLELVILLDKPFDSIDFDKLLESINYLEMDKPGAQSINYMLPNPSKNDIDNIRLITSDIEIKLKYKDFLSSTFKNKVNKIINNDS